MRWGLLRRATALVARGMSRAPLLAVVLAACLPAAAGASSGAWDRAWGNGVNGGAGPEICTVAANCHLGSGGNPGGAVFPQDVATDGAGNVYVAEFSYHRVQKFDAQGHFLLAWGKNVDAVNPSTGFEVCTAAANCQTGEAGTLGGELHFPHGIATDAGGHVYVADRDNDRIQEFTSSGAFMSAFGQDVSISKSGNIETCDLASDCKAGTAAGSGGGVLFFPQDVAVGTDGRVYVANGQRRIEVFKADFSFDRTWGADVINGGGTGFEVCTVDTQCKTGEIGSGRGGETSLVASVATSPAGDVYDFESNRFRVERFTADGGFQSAWGQDVDASDAGTDFEVCTVADNCKTGVTGSGSGAFRSPNDMVAPASDSVAADGTGTVYVADRENDRVQAFSPGGQFGRTWGTGVDPNNGSTGYEVCTAMCTSGSEQQAGGSLVKPTGIAAGATGDVYTADQTGGRIQKFTCSASTVAFSSATATIAEGAGTAHLTVQRTGDTGCGASVHYATANGSATAGSDYDSTSGTLTFAIDQTGRTIDVPITPDTAHESDETFSVTLDTPVSPATIGAPATSTVTITDDDAIDTAITSGPDGATNNPTPSFGFTADPSAGATFVCSVDHSSPAACSSPFTTGHLGDGDHLFAVAAVSPGGVHDSTPATRSFSVDTVAPTTSPQIIGGQRVGQTNTFHGAVGLDASASDPAPSGGGVQTRCAYNGAAAAPPDSFGSLSECTFPIVSAPGDYAFYAASRDAAGNVETPVRSVKFTLLPGVEVSITSGPEGPTWSKQSLFGFTSSTAGATYRCKIDGGAYVTCQSPWLSPVKNSGNHAFYVKAVAPDGTESNVEARYYTIQSPRTESGHCAVNPFVVDPDNPNARRIVGCGFGQCPSRIACSAAIPPCPVGALCTLRFTSHWESADPLTTFALYGACQLNPGTCLNNELVSEWWVTQRYDGVVDLLGGYPYCHESVLGDPNACDVTTTQTIVGRNRTISPTCSAALNSTVGPSDPVRPGGTQARDFGPDSSRHLDCDATESIAPASALDIANVSPGQFTTYVSVPAPGPLTVTTPPGRKPHPKGAASAARKRPAKPGIKPIHINVKHPGAVRIRFQLNKTAKRQLTRRHKLKLRVKFALKPPHHATITHTHTVTFTHPPKPPTARQRRQAIRKLCRRKHPHNARLCNRL